MHNHSNSADLPALRTVTDSKASRHQVGPQQTRSLSGDECCDLQCHARITTQKITRLPIFPPDDRFPCCTKQRGLAIDLGEGPSLYPAQYFSHVLLTTSFSHLQPSVQSQTTLVKSGVSSDGGRLLANSLSKLPNRKTCPLCDAGHKLKNQSSMARLLVLNFRTFFSLKQFEKKKHQLSEAAYFL